MQDSPTVLRFAAQELIALGVYEVREGIRKHGLLRRHTRVPILVATRTTASYPVPLAFVDQTIRDLSEDEHGAVVGRSLFAYANRANDRLPRPQGPSGNAGRSG